jgi:hypothetical protein
MGLLCFCLWNMTRYELRAPWGWHNNVDRCRSSKIVCQFIVHWLVIVQNNKSWRVQVLKYNYKVLLFINTERSDLWLYSNVAIRTANTHCHAGSNPLTSPHSVSRHCRWTHLRWNKKTRYFYFQLWKSLPRTYAVSVSVIKIPFASRNIGRAAFPQSVRYFNLGNI